MVKRYGELMQEVTKPLVREVFAAGMDVRMIVAALRRRRHGLGPPTVGFGQWFEHIRRHFNQPDFRLGHVFPWILPFEQMLEQGDVLALYRRVLGDTWAYLKKRAEDYDSSASKPSCFTSLAGTSSATGSSCRPSAAGPSSKRLVTEALGEYAKLYLEARVIGVTGNIVSIESDAPIMKNAVAFVQVGERATQGRGAARPGPPPTCKSSRRPRGCTSKHESL